MPGDEGLSAASVAVGSIHLVLQNVFSTLVGVLGYAFMARAVTLEEMGVVAGVTLLHSLIQVLVDFGLNSSIARFVSESIGRRMDYSKHVASALVFRLMVVTIASSQICFFSATISQAFFGTPEYSSLLTIVAVDMVLVSAASLLNGVLLGSGRLRAMAFFNVSSTVVRWFSIILFLLEGYGLTGIFYGWITGSLTLLAMLIFSALKPTRFKKALEGASSILRSMLKFSLPLYAASIVSFAYAWYDKALILVFLPLQQLGVYNVVYTAFSVFVSIASSLGSSLLPYYGVMYGMNAHEAISDGVRRASKYTMLMLFPLALGLASTSRQVLSLFAGQQYEPGWLTLATLSVFGLVYGLYSALSNLLLIYGRTKTILTITLASTLLSIAFMPLVTLLNLVGLAIVRGVSILLSFTLSMFSISRIMRMRIDTPVALKILFSSTVMAVAVIIAQHFLQSRLFLPLHVLVGVATYVFLIRVTGVLNVEDAKLIGEILGERLSRIIVRIMRIRAS